MGIHKTSNPIHFLHPHDGNMVAPIARSLREQILRQFAAARSMSYIYT